MKQNNFLEFVKNFENLRSDLSVAILGNVVVTISDERGIVWSCNDNKWQDKRFENWEVKQDFEIDNILEKVYPIFVKMYEAYLNSDKCIIHSFDKQGICFKCGCKDE